jgi:hypothetical protein
MAPIEWPAVESNIGTVPTDLDVALGAIVTPLAQRLKWPVPELVEIAMMRLDVIADRRWFDNARLGAVFAERVLAQLVLADSHPTRRRVQVGPGTNDGERLLGLNLGNDLRDLFHRFIRLRQ